MLAICRILRVRIENTDWHFQFFVDDPDWLGEIRVVRNHDQLIAVIAKRAASMYVAMLTSEPFSSIFSTRTVGEPVAGGRREPHRHDALQEVPVVHGEVWNRLKSPDVKLLTLGNLWICSRRLYEGGEIPNAIYRDSG